MDNIRAYNSSMAFASFAANIEHPPGRGPYCFRIHGAIYHRASTELHPAQGNPSFGQLYIIESNLATDFRMQINSNLDEELLGNLDTLMREINPYSAAYKLLHEVERTEQKSAAEENRSPTTVFMVLGISSELDERRYNLPTTANEVAAVFVSNDGLPPSNVRLAVYPRNIASNHPLTTISFLDPNCDPMTYPLLFPHGEKGWQPGTEHQNPTGVRNQITTLQHYSYRLAVRSGFSLIHSAGKLTQQYIVDGYVKCESNRLNFIRQNQPSLRSELYSGLMDHINNRSDTEGTTVGRLVILPSSYCGSQRAMQQLYQDAMAMVREFGRPDIFITFTCNPKWLEISDNLEPYQTAANRPDLTVRVFNLKLKEFFKDIIQSEVLGKVTAYILYNRVPEERPTTRSLLIYIRSSFETKNTRGY